MWIQGSLCMLASPTDILRHASRIPSQPHAFLPHERRSRGRNAWRTPNNVCGGGYMHAIMQRWIWNLQLPIDGKGYIYLENQAFSTVNLRQWFGLRAISHLYSCSNSEVFVYVWLSLEKSIGEFSMVYKKWVLWCGLGPVITISTCN